ncbi:MAG: CBS and ACT domain-containing protein [Desulfotomaculaceae bacterium]|nr:CBS and ACT domain-containing protein [Desulfotomaculaceae bacterium]
MFVRDYMARAPISITKDTPVFKALTIMKNNKIRHLPVVTERGKYLGMATEKNLFYLAPSPATSLSIFEINTLMAEIKVAEAMREIPAVTPDTTLEEAALLMKEQRTNGIPVVENDTLVGIITESDIFEALANVFGYGKPGIRMVIEAKDTTGLIAEITKIIKDFDIAIRSIVTIPRDDVKVGIVLRLSVTDPAPLVEALKKNGFTVSNILG